MTKKFLITSALPYANGPLHFGHIAGAYLPADCFARFQRLAGNDVLYICGSDEYGVAITMSAEKAGKSPKEHVDQFHAVNKEFFNDLSISFDHYSRTTWDGHDETVHKFFLDLLGAGFIEELVTDQLYSEADQKFLADRYVVGECPRCGYPEARGDECPKCGSSYEATDLINPRSKMTKAPLVRKATKHWFLMLDKMKDRLEEWIAAKNWKPNVVNFIKGYIQDLRPRAITRDSDWGVKIPLPNTEGKVLYVWFDAPIGYISAAKEWAQKSGDRDAWKKYWMDPETTLVNFIGKDNIPFHAAIFPAMLMGQSLPYKLVDELPANEFYNLEGRQFSKSDGWTIDLERFFANFTADQIRYVIAANAPETSDSEFSWKDFQVRCNSELLGKYGNLVNRTLVFAKQHTAAKAPNLEIIDEDEKEFIRKLAELTDEANQAYSGFKVRRASQIVMEIAHLGNAFFDHRKPWVDAKDETTRPRMERTIALCLEGIKAMALVSSPIIPKTAEKIWQMLGYTNELAKQHWDSVLRQPIQAGTLFGEISILFKRVEEAIVLEEISLLDVMSKKAAVKKIEEQHYPPIKEAIEIDDVRKLDLRVGVVVGAVPLPKSKKLLQLTVDLGFEKRSIVAGIKEHYSPEKILGQKVVIVANLKPAILMGVESQGMVLAASDLSGLEVVSVQNISPGAAVS